MLYIQGLRFTSIDLLGKTYSSIGIRNSWPDNPDEAQVTLMLYASQQDAPTYLETLNDFIETFPNVPDGYLSRASHYVRFRGELAASQTDQTQMLAKATEDLNRYLKANPREDDGLFNQAKLIYEVLLDDHTIESKDWNIRIASEKLQRAITINDSPVYRQLEGNIAFFQGDFEKAYELYMTVNQSPFASSLSFYLASNAKQRIAGGNMLEVIALMDSAVAKSLTIPSEAAAYLQESIDLKMQFGLYEAAVRDYNQLYRALSGNVSDVYYYYREQAKFRLGDLDGALNDIETAIAIDPQNAVYYAEEASVYLRMLNPARAVESLNKSIALDPEFAASHRLLGVCLLRLEKKEEACLAFQKAKELGDPIVDRLIAENCR
jgi:tetratricopeptide (TPR) repeat protein